MPLSGPEANQLLSALGLDALTASNAVIGLNAVISVLLVIPLIILIKQDLAFRYKREMTFGVTLISLVFCIASIGVYSTKVLRSFEPFDCPRCDPPTNLNAPEHSGGYLFRWLIFNLVDLSIGIICLSLYYYYLHRDSLIPSMTMPVMLTAPASAFPAQEAQPVANHNISMPPETSATPLVQGQAHSDYVRM